MHIDQPLILERITQRVWPGAALIHAEALRGGVSAQALLLHVRHADGAFSRYVVRVHGAVDRQRSPDIALREYALLQHLRAAGLPVAHPVHLDASGEVFPLPYLVVSYVDGATAFAPRDLPRFIQQAAALLAQIHQVRDAPDFLSSRAALALARINAQPDAVDDSIDEAGLRATLRALFPLRQANAPALLHGDFWPGNLIWRADGLAGIIDWEDADRGDPLADLGSARLEMLWAFGQAAMRDFTRAYQAHMPHLDYGSLPGWDLFAALRPAGHLDEWAATWADSGRPDVTAAALREAQRWFVAQALRQLDG